MRPYADPYRDRDDGDSMISAWSVDENVRKLLYDDETSTVVGLNISFKILIVYINIIKFTTTTNFVYQCLRSCFIEPATFG